MPIKIKRFCISNIVKAKNENTLTPKSKTLSGYLIHALEDIINHTLIITFQIDNDFQ